MNIIEFSVSIRQIDNPCGWRDKIVKCCFEATARLVCLFKTSAMFKGFLAPCGSQRIRIWLFSERTQKTSMLA